MDIVFHHYIIIINDRIPWESKENPHFLPWDDPKTQEKHLKKPSESYLKTTQNHQRNEEQCKFGEI